MGREHKGPISGGVKGVGLLFFYNICLFFFNYFKKIILLSPKAQRIGNKETNIQTITITTRQRKPNKSLAQKKYSGIDTVWQSRYEEY